MAQVLVVDDSATVRNEVGDFLKKNGLDVITAVDGRDGLAKLKADRDGMKFGCGIMFAFPPELIQLFDPETENSLL